MTEEDAPGTYQLTTRNDQAGPGSVLVPLGDSH